jgi:LmbE family N-acetylglucosaminyl deacetylase
MSDDQNQARRAIVVSAHADDHIACAGTLMKLQAQGYSVYELILTTSAEGRDFRTPVGDYDVAQLRQDEFSAASKFLGTKQIFQMSQEDLGLTYSKDLMLRLAGIIRQVQPTIGLIHNAFDWHPDHRAANQLSSEAFKWAASGVRPDMGEAWRTPIVLAFEGMLPIQPNIMVDVTEFVAKKMELYRIYESQAKPKALNFEEGLMSVRGYHLRRPGSLMAESFSTDPTSPIILFDE